MKIFTTKRVKKTSAYSHSRLKTSLYLGASNLLSYLNKKLHIMATLLSETHGNELFMIKQYSNL